MRAALQDARRVSRSELGARLGADWALVVFFAMAAPPALILAGLLQPGVAPVAHWLSACGCLFLGLALAPRLEPLPPRRVFDADGAGDRMRNLSRPAMQKLDPSLDRNLADCLFDAPPEPEISPLDLPGIQVGMSRGEALEQLAKLREQGDLSGAEYDRALRQLLGG